MRHDERLDEDTRLRTEDLVAAGETRPANQENADIRPDDADALPPPRTADGAEYSLPDNDNYTADGDNADRTRDGEAFTDRASDTDADADRADAGMDTDRTDTDTDQVDTGTDTHRVDTDTDWSHTDQEAEGSGSTDSSPEQVEESARPAAPSSEDEDQAPLLFRPEDVDRFRTEWQQVQTMFVDDPREAVQSADHLVAEVMQALASMFNEHKQELEGHWREESADLQTEDLRIALRRYRSFFYQLLDA